jgi:hypothetical protein
MFVWEIILQENEGQMGKGQISSAGKMEMEQRG